MALGDGRTSSDGGVTRTEIARTKLGRARTDEARVKILRKQMFTGLSAVLQHATRWKPDLIVGYGQGGLLAALAALPLVVEAAYPGDTS